MSSQRTVTLIRIVLWSEFARVGLGNVTYLYFRGGFALRFEVRGGVVGLHRC